MTIGHLGGSISYFELTFFLLEQTQMGSIDASQRIVSVHYIP